MQAHYLLSKMRKVYKSARSIIKTITSPLRKIVRAFLNLLHCWFDCYASLRVIEYIYIYIK